MVAGGGPVRGGSTEVAVLVLEVVVVGVAPLATQQVEVGLRHLFAQRDVVLFVGHIHRDVVQLQSHIDFA